MNTENNSNTHRSRMRHRKRSKYINLLGRARDIQESSNSGLAMVDEIRKIIEETDFLYSGQGEESSGRSQEEAILDAKIVTATSNVLVKCTKSLNVATGIYNPELFAEQMNNKFVSSSGELDIDAFLDSVSNQITFLLFNDIQYPTNRKESASVLPKVRKVRERVSINSEMKKEPELVQNLTVEEQNVSRMVKRIENVLISECLRRENETVNYYELLFDPTDFSATIENIYHFSFLIRDGKARIVVDDNNMPYVSPVMKEELEAHTGSNKQTIISLTIKAWKEIVQELGITKCLVPRD